MNSSANTQENLSPVQPFPLIRKKIGAVRSAYYPCSWNDVRLSEAFPEAIVMRLDAKFGSGTETPERCFDIVGDATEFVCEKEVDLVFLSNPSLWHPNLVRSVRAGGFVIANEYHGTATLVNKLTDFRLIGCESVEWDWIEAASAIKRLQAVSDDEEWKLVSPASFEKTLEVRASVLSKYGAVLWNEQEGQSLRDWLLLAQERKAGIEIWMERSDKEWNEFDVFAMELSQDMYGLPRLPKKIKGYPDDLYLFQKNG